MENEPYRPSNGTEGMIFMDKFCDRCERYDDCEIQVRSMLYEINHLLYPKQWVKDEDGQGKCTEFKKIEGE